MIKKFNCVLCLVLFCINAWGQISEQVRVEDSLYCFWEKKTLHENYPSDRLAPSPGWRYDYFYSDEFENHVIDTTKWNIRNHYMHGNNPHMGYMSDTTHVYIENGRLYLNVTENVNNDSCHYNLDSTYFTPELLSGGVQSVNPIRYGYLETECYLPKNHRYWPCFWMHGRNGQIQEYDEVDVFERTRDNNTDSANIIRQNCYNDYGYADTSSTTQVLIFPDSITGKISSFGVEILPKEIVFYINGHVSSRLRYHNKSMFNPWNTFTCSDVEDMISMMTVLSLNCDSFLTEIPQPHEPAWFGYFRCYKLERGSTDVYHPTVFEPNYQSVMVYPHVILGGSGCSAYVGGATAVWGEQDIILDKGFELPSGMPFTARVIQVPDAEHSSLYIQNCHQQQQTQKP